MPNGNDIASTLKNPDFQGLPDAEKQKFLSTYVPEFSQLPADEQTKFLTKYAGVKTAAPVSLTEQYMAEHGTTPDYGDLAAMRQHTTTGASITAVNKPDWWERTKNFFKSDQQADIESATNDRMQQIKDQREGKKPNFLSTDVLDKPMVPLGSFVSQEAEQNPGYHQQGINTLSVIQGLGGASADVVSGLSTPRNLAILGALSIPGTQAAGYAMLVNRLVAAGFSADMAKGAADELVEGYKDARSGDTAGATRHFTSGTVSAAFAILSGAHAGRPGIRAEYEAGASAPPEGHDITPPTPQKAPTKVSLAQEGHLVSKLGYTRDQVANMSPQDAHDVITGNKPASPGDFPAPPPPPAPADGAQQPEQQPEPQPEQPSPFAMPNPQDLPAHVAAQARLAQIAYEKGYDVPTYLKKIRDERMAGEGDVEDQHALEDAESHTPFQAEKPVNTTMAEKMREAMNKVGEKDQLRAHLESVANENLYVDADDMARSLAEKKGLGKPLTPSEKEALGQYKRMQELPEFKLKEQAAGPLGEPPKPPSFGQEAPTKPPIATSQTPKAANGTQVPTAKPTEGPYSPEQVSWLTGLFKGKAEMGTLNFDVAAGHYGDTDAMLQQMQDAGLIEEHGREVVGRGTDKKVYPTYKLTDEGVRLRRHWASKQFPGEAPEFTPAPPTAVAGGAPTAEPENSAKPPAQPLFEDEVPGNTGDVEAKAKETQAAIPQVPEITNPKAEEHIKASGMIGTSLMSDDPNSPVMVEHPLLKGQGLQVTMDRKDINSPAAVKAALRNKLDELKAPIPEDLKTKEEKEKEADVYKPADEIAGIKGKKTTIHTPNGSHPAVYRVVEADDLKPSHNPMTFKRNDAYPIENERQYHNNSNAQAETEKYAKDAKWDLFINGDPTASNGPSQSLPDGTVLGGNGRTMALQLAYDRVGTGDTYKQHLIEHADEFGIDPAKVAAMRHPVLDRMLTDPGESKKQLEKVGKDLNKPFAKKASTTEQAVSAGTSLSLDSAKKIGEGLTSLGDEATLRKLFSESPQMFRDIAMQDGILSQGDLPQYFSDDGALNDAGKDFFENTLLGSIVRDADLLEKMPAGIKGKLERILAPVLEVSQRPDSWNIGDQLRDALRASTSASANGKNINDWVNQTGFDKDGRIKEPIPDDVATLAVALSKKPTEVAGMFKRFASEARQDIPGQEGMFGAPDPREAFDRIFKGEGTGGTNAATAFRSQPRAKQQRMAAGVAPAPIKTAADFQEIPVRPMESPVKEFYKEDVIPAAVGAFNGIKESWRRVRNVIAPVNSENLNTALNIRKFGAEQTKTMHQFKYSNEDAWDFFTKFDRVARMHNVSMVDAGKGAELAKELGVPEVEQWVNLMNKARNDAWNEALKYRGADASALTRPDYWLAHYYETEDGRPLGTILSKRSLEGGKSFLKKREFPTMAEFIKYAKDELDVDIKPKFDNPVAFEAAKINEITQYIKGQKTLAAQEAVGRVKTVHALDPNTPEGYSKLPDALGTIYAPPTYTVHEAFDDLLMKRIDSLTKSLGVAHNRAVNIGGSGRWGYAMGDSNITSKVGGPERVITHELGHIMDERYSLAQRWVNDPFMKQEFRDLADLRSEGRSPSDSYQKYIRKGSEKIANAFDAYVHNPEAMKDVAPTIKNAIDLLIDKHPELRPLREIKPSQVLGTAEYQAPTGHIGIMAYRYVPDADIPLYRNYTSEGLMQNPVFNGYRQSANFMNSLQLGFSGFHAGFTANDAAASRFALGAQKLAHGDIMDGLKDIATGNIFVAPIQQFMTGTRMLDGYETGNPADPAVAKALDYLIRAGGADRMDDFYRTGAVHSFYDEMRAGNGIGAALRAGPAAAEGISNIVLDKLVPRMKLAAFKELAEFEIKKLHDDYAKEGLKPTEMDENRVLARAYDSIENRLGQLRYDNLFWNKTFKDLLMASVRSVGWNLGTLREFTGAVGDVVRGAYNASTGKGKMEFTPRMAYAITYPLIMGMQGAIAFYLMNGGKSPESAKDLYFPRTGNKNPDGTDERVSFPSYIKDLYAYGSGFQTGISDGVSNVEHVASQKIHPFLKMLMELHSNEDWRHVQIADHSDPIGQQIEDYATYIAKQFIPFSVANAERRLDASGKEGVEGLFSPETLSSMFGISPAPRDIDRSKAQKLAFKFMRETNPPGVRTNETNERMNMHAQVVRTMRQDMGKGVDKIEQGIKDGTISQRDIASFRTQYKTSWLQHTVGRLSLKRALEVYDAGEPEEQDALKKVILTKVRNEMPKLNQQQRQELINRVRPIIGHDAQGPLGSPPTPPQFASPQQSPPR